ncbi:hypothetical protein SeMB42_g02427 [Synchytrium endobioticum]|uniref:DNA topoisomerase I n=1 Tax=Synchytrium endobioticum TaxID=286115 RepID=A0A507D1T0_9FUNG|nr:hypothetical protein SeLEV6574_g03869 [Synchytrium endobioticum]TPX49949.1 hypothetical protein SeMB42_g02427 [Synchytrium endobioticum]
MQGDQENQENAASDVHADVKMMVDPPVQNGTDKGVADGSSDSDSDADVPLSRRSRKAPTVTDEDRDDEFDQSSSSEDADDEDDDYISGSPNANRRGTPRRKPAGRANRRTTNKRAISESSSVSSASVSSDGDVFLTRRKKPANTSAAKNASENGRTKKTPPNKKQKKAALSDGDKSADLKPGATTLLKEKATASKRKRSVKEEPVDSDDSDVPLAVKKQKKSESEVRDASDSDDSDVPLAAKIQKNASNAALKGKKATVKREDDAESGTPARKGRIKKQDEEEETYDWWNNMNQDKSIKWTTMQHNGVVFPPPYEPHSVKMLYDGKEVELEPAAEEVATWYAALVGTVWDENPRFRKNFFEDWMEILKESKKPCPIKEIEKCDFSPIIEHLNRLKEAKKNRTKEEKLKEKEAKAEIEKQYGIAVLDGRKEKIGNFRIEPPGLFRGRGEHPKTGRIKRRVRPEDVTLNLSEDAIVPPAPTGHKWAGVVHDNTKTWLATWKDIITDHKYVFLSDASSIKGQSDYKKFEKARELKKHIRRIRRDYESELKDKSMEARQRATAVYLIDKLALRAGNEKGEDEADTVGCCSLRYEHITLEPPNKVIFDFLGKDSIRYYNEVAVAEQVFKNLKIFKREPKAEGDPIFDRLDTSTLNRHLQKYQKGLTAKVFRTYNASWTFQQQLERTPADGTVQEKVLAYNRANREVAVLCNHQRTVSKSHGGQMSKLQDKVLALKYDRMKIKEEMLEIDPKLPKVRPELAKSESDLDDEFIERHEIFLREKAVEAAKKKFEKDNAKRKEKGEEPLSESEMPEPRVERRSLTLDKLEKTYSKVCERIEAAKMIIVDKDENKTTATGTSKINYIDPRISVAWCKKYDVPLEKVFNRTLIRKFKWAQMVDGEWEF